jgi:hypothetical protein
MPVELALFPGFADGESDEPWTLRASIRLYADSGVTLSPAAGDQKSLTVPPGQTVSRTFALPDSPWPLGDGFFPLGIFVARSAEQTWMREGGLPLPNPPMMR